MRADNRVKLARPGQLELFTLEAPVAVVQQAAEQLGKEIKAQQQENKAPRSTKRMVLPAHLERREVIIDPQGDLSGYKLIGSEQTEVLVIEPLRMWVKCIIRRKLGAQRQPGYHQAGCTGSSGSLPDGEKRPVG